MYASRTGTRRNLAELRAYGWRLLVSATGVWDAHRLPYAIDNGAWTAHQQGTAWDAGAFMRVCYRMGDCADWVVLPDIVAGGGASLDLSLRWLDKLGWLAAPKLVAVQDGMAPADLKGIAGPGVGIFLGGTTEWKLRTMAAWGDFAKRECAYYHVGRVNTARRIHACVLAGADSCDGTSASRFARTVRPLSLASAQMALRHLR